MFRPIAFAATLLCISSLLVACGGGGGSIAPSQPGSTSTPAPTPGPSSTVTVGSTGTSVVLATGNLHASISLPGASAGAGSPLIATLSTAPPSGVGAPQIKHRQISAHAGVAYISFTATSAVTLSGTIAATVTLPPSSASQQYYLATYVPGQGWTYDVAGPVTASSSGTVTFFATIPASAPVTIAAGSTYVLAVTTDTPYTSVTVSFPIMPQAVAAQVGTQAWQSVSVSGNTAIINLPPDSTKFGVAYVCPMVSSITQEFVLQYTTSEMTSVTAPCPAPTAPPAIANVSGTFDVSAIPTANNATIAIGSYSAFGSQSGTFSGAYTAGPADIVALATAGYSIVGAKILRGQTITNNETITIPPFATSDATTTESILFPTSPQGFIPNETMSYRTAGGTSATVSNLQNQATYAVIPAIEAQSADYYDSKYQDQRLELTMMETLTYEKTFTSAQSLSVAAPSNPQFFAVAAATLPTFTFDNGSLPQGAFAYDSANVSYNAYSITALLSSGWMGSVTTYALPDLSSIARFAGSPTSGTSVSWGQQSISSTTQLSPMSLRVVQSPLWAPSPVPVNATVQTVGSSGNYSVP